MQNRYAGDVGDFGKLGLLRCIAGLQCGIGVNWYLVPDESHNADGKHVGYVTDARYDGCDDTLRDSLKAIVKGRRSVFALETMDLIPNAVYYHEVLHSPSRFFSRRDWHAKALETLGLADIVFLDPDNGLLVKSVSAGSIKSNKYLFPNEAADYFAAGKSVIIYNHRCREQESVYLRRFDWMREDSILKDAVITGVTFRRGTVRDFIFALQPGHATEIRGCVDYMLQGPWGNHFSKAKLIPLINASYVTAP
ncbi:MAG: hypothetical protein BWY65_01406 [Firmicutes bacterium ADurb.Bin373]|nr:MAG: hypothetical protein BWY65_01406 [Firmicutes bacterium ADurb.Bin373]